MTSYYCNPSAGTNGSGTAASPFNTPASFPTGAGNVYHFKRATTWSGVIPSLTSGTSGSVTTVKAYANTDGSDNTALAKPIINLGDNILQATKTFMKFSNLDIRSVRVTLASDTPIWFMGNDCEVSDCNLDTNLTVLYAIGKSRCQILRNTIKGATAASSSFSMTLLALSGATAMDSNNVDDNAFLVGEGGNAGSHVIRIETGVSTNLKVRRNTVNTVSGILSTHATKLGIYLSNLTGTAPPQAAAGCEVANNTVTNLTEGIFINGATNVWVHHNTLNANAHFGLHVTTVTSGFIVEWNTCRRNGSNTRSFYGRGMEFSGAATLNACTAHVIRFNDCSYNYNWGGPGDNATEGVGIGLDDGTTFCLVYGNMLYKNEGNGLQTYTGVTPPADTGGSMINGNFFISNATFSYKNRRSGTQYLTAGACQLGVGGSAGSVTTIANNLFVGAPIGVGRNSASNNIKIFNNVFKIGRAHV